MNSSTLNLRPKVIGNKAKGRISKRVLQENKARPIFQKTNISYSLIRTRTGKVLSMFVCDSYKDTNDLYLWNLEKNV